MRCANSWRRPSLHSACRSRRPLLLLQVLPLRRRQRAALARLAQALPVARLQLAKIPLWRLQKRRRLPSPLQSISSPRRARWAWCRATNALKALSGITACLLDRGLKALVAWPWDKLTAVGDASPYVSGVAGILRVTVPLVRAKMSEAASRLFCDKAKLQLPGAASRPISKRNHKCLKMRQSFRNY